MQGSPDAGEYYGQSKRANDTARVFIDTVMKGRKPKRATKEGGWKFQLPTNDIREVKHQVTAREPIKVVAWARR